MENYTQVIMENLESFMAFNDFEKMIMLPYIDELHNRNLVSNCDYRFVKNIQRLIAFCNRQNNEEYLKLLIIILLLRKNYLECFKLKKISVEISIGQQYEEGFVRELSSFADNPRIAIAHNKKYDEITILIAGHMKTMCSINLNHIQNLNIIIDKNLISFYFTYLNKNWCVDVKGINIQDFNAFIENFR